MIVILRKLSNYYLSIFQYKRSDMKCEIEWYV